MENTPKKPELLAPAGDMEGLEAALRFGADAVYLGGPFLQLRAAKAGFSASDVRLAAERTRSAGKKLFVTVNSYAYTDEIGRVGEYVKFLADAGADAIIVADLGVLAAAKEACPDLDVIVSTQFNAMNAKTAEVLWNLGAKRLVLARELSIEEIRRVREECPKGLELEAFCHGAMCMAYSGRCLISAYLAGRSGNRGECAQPCRWNYRLEEEKRPGEYFDVEESGQGTAILSSRDLCALPLLDELAEAGIVSLKIEGRMKSPFYIASVTNAYRMALDRSAPFEAIARELCAVSHRPYTAGFFVDRPGSEKDRAALGSLLATGSDNGEYIRERTFVGAVLDPAAYLASIDGRAADEVARIAEIRSTKRKYKAEDVTPKIDPAAVRRFLAEGYVPVETRNYFEAGEGVELLTPGLPGGTVRIDAIRDETGAEGPANHPMRPVLVRTDAKLRAGDLLRADSFNKKR